MAGLATGDSIVNPDSMFENAGVRLLVDRAEHVDAGARRVQLASGQEIPYDRLLLATGSRPVVPSVEGNALHGVFTLRSLRDAEAIRHYLDETGARRLVFVGAGFVSLEVATLLAASAPDFEITVVELLEHPLPLMIDADIAATVGERLTARGLDLRMGRRLERILGDDGRVTQVELDGGETVDADMVFLNVGACPDLTLARELGLEVGKYGIRVDRFLATSHPDILAAGDTIENLDFLTGRPVPVQLRGPAVIQGRLAAKVLAGFKIPFPGVLGNSAVKLFDLNVGATGMTETRARREGFDPVCTTVVSRSKHRMIPGARPWTIKLVFDRPSRRLLGGQILSDSDAPVKEIDAVNALILGGKTVEDLTLLMTAGNPDCSSEPSAEPITIAAEQALQKIAGGTTMKAGGAR